MAYCLIKPLADVFKKALKEGKIDPGKLADMSSAERRDFFSTLVDGENAKNINTLFESKLLLKDTQRGMISWAKEITGLKPEARKSLIDRIEKLDERILNPAEQKAFLEDLAAKKIGIEVTLEEAQQISRLSKNLSEARKNIDKNPIEYGVARVEMENLLNEAKRKSKEVKLSDFKTNAPRAAINAISKIGGIAKSMKATLDVSALGRQGFKAIFTHPKQWAVNVGRTFVDIFQTLARNTSDDSVMDGLRAEIYSRKNSTSGLYDKMKLAIGTGEEAYPSSLPEKIPGLGRIFKASEVAYNGFLTRLRADIADRYIEIAEAQGIDINNKVQAESIGSLVNSLTGRGNAFLGKGGEIINSTFFSPKNLQSNLDFLTLHAFEKMTPFARKQALINVLKVAGGVAAVFAIAKAIQPDSVETDARSSDFGKIKIGDTRFDVSGGMSSLVTLIARLAPEVLGGGAIKNSTTGAITPFGTGFGEKNRWDVLGQFAENKLAPVASVVRDVAKQRDFSGNPITLGGEASNLLMPLPIANAIKTVNSSASGSLKVATIIADALGFASNTYEDKTNVGQRFVENKELAKTLHDLSNTVGKKINFTDWDTSKSPDLLEFRQKLGENSWQDAKARYDYQIKTRVDEALQNPKFKNFSDAQKVEYLNQIDTDAKEKVFSQFAFKRKKSPPKKKLKL